MAVGIERMSSPIRGLFSRVRLLALAAGTVAAAASLGVPAPQASAAPTPCKATEVTVIVVGQKTGCARAGLTGAQALEDAGFRLTRVQTQPGFLCRINGAPADDPCVRTPPATAYWSYWHAPLGGQWTYSQWGADNRTAPAGTVEAWVFGDSARPGAVPDAPAAATTTRQSAPRPQATVTQTAAPRPRPEAPAAGAPAVERAVVQPGEPVQGAEPSDPAGDSPAAPAAPAPAPAGAPGSPAGTGDPVGPDGQPGQPDPAAPADGGAPPAGELPPEEAPVADGLGEEPVAEEGVLASDDTTGATDGTDVVATGVAEQSQSPWPYVAVGGLVLVLTGAGVYAARRYRQ